MRTYNLQQIRAMLLMGNSADAKKISHNTGLSYSTVARGLIELGATKVPGTWPVEWRIEHDNDIVVSKEPKIGEGDKRVSIPIREQDDWPKRWDNSREQFGMNIATMKITPKDDPKELALAFQKAATSLASIAYALDQASGSPDWYALIGGELEPNTQTK